MMLRSWLTLEAFCLAFSTSTFVMMASSYLGEKQSCLFPQMKWTRRRRKVSQSPKVSSGPAFSELYNWTHEQPLNTGGVQQYYLLNFFFATGIQPDPASGHGWRLQGLVCFLRLLEAIVHSSKRPLSRQVAMRVLRPRFPQLLLHGLQADHSRSAETKKKVIDSSRVAQQLRFIIEANLVAIAMMQETFAAAL